MKLFCQNKSNSSLITNKMTFSLLDSLSIIPSISLHLNMYQPYHLYDTYLNRHKFRNTIGTNYIPIIKNSPIEDYSSVNLNPHNITNGKEGFVVGGISFLLYLMGESN